MLVNACVDGRLTFAHGHRRGSKNCEIALKIVQNLSAHEDTGEELLRQGALDQALDSAKTGELKVLESATLSPRYTLILMLCDDFPYMRPLSAHVMSMCPHQS